MTTGYPAILLLDGRLGVVIGGGEIAERKTSSLLDAGATVRVIAPTVTARIRDLADAGMIDVVEREYRPGDLGGAAIVIAATDDAAVNHGVYREATESGIPVNVVDDPPRCSFIAPSIVRRGDLVIAISTGGRSPALAVRIRERLEREFGSEYEEFLSLVGELRDEGPPAGAPNERARAWYRVVDGDVIDLLREGRGEDARARARALLSTPDGSAGS